MSTWCDVRAIHTGTGNTPIVVTGLPGQPKALIAFLTALTTPGTNASIDWSFGSGTGSGSGASTSRAKDNVTASSIGLWRNANLVNDITTAMNSGGQLVITTLDANGYTVTPTTAFAASYEVVVMAIGGDSITNVFAGGCSVASGTGNDTPVTGLGFQPDFILFHTGTVGQASGALTAGFQHHIGAADGTNNWSFAIVEQTAVSPSVVHHHFDDSYCFATMAVTGTSCTRRVALASFDTDGFTLNRIESSAGTGTSALRYLAFKSGGNIKCGTTTMRTDTNNQAVTGLSYKPVGLLLVSGLATANLTDTPGDHYGLSVGVTDGTTQGSIWIGSEHAVTAANTNEELSATRVLMNRNVNTQANDGDMSFESFETGGFTLDQEGAAAAAYKVGYVAFGPDVAAGGTKNYYRQTIGEV